MTSSLIRVSQSDVGLLESEAVASVISDGYLGMGTIVEQFELELKSYLHTTNDVICVSSGTAALHLSLQASGIGPGDEVLVPSITYLATYQAISATGATAVSCDVIPHTIFLDPCDVLNRITTRTKAILPVHYAGSNLGIREINQIATEYNLAVIEDAAHSFGSRSHNGDLIGSSERLLCFSFDGIKNITSGEGGAVVTSSPDIAQKIRDARLLGVCGDSSARYSNQRSWAPSVKAQGWRYHMSNIFASIGLTQLRTADKRFFKAQIYCGNLPQTFLWSPSYQTIGPQLSRYRSSYLPYSSTPASQELYID